MSMLTPEVFDTPARQLYDARLMSNGLTANVLPAQIDPIRLAEEGIRLQGSVSTREMRRLPLTAASAIDIDFEFFKAAPGRFEMRGRLRAAVTLTCQRCLAPMPWLIDAAPQLRFFRNEAAVATNADEVEAVTVTGPVRLAELVEDELLLALPMIPLHAAGSDCAAAPVADKGADKPHPFAALAKLKTQKR